MGSKSGGSDNRPLRTGKKRAGRHCNDPPDMGAPELDSAPPRSCKAPTAGQQHGAEPQEQNAARFGNRRRVERQAEEGHLIDRVVLRKSKRPMRPCTAPRRSNPIRTRIENYYSMPAVDRGRVNFFRKPQISCRQRGCRPRCNAL